MNIAAVVVLYHPTADMLKNSETYLDEVKKLYIIDNSDFTTLDIMAHFQSTSKVEYIDNKGNQGIANALNIAALKAIEAGYSWMLTMDQDSRISEGMLEKLARFQGEDVAVISPYHADRYFPTASSKQEVQEVLAVATSGNLLNLKAFEKIGPFEEKLFIDYVDIEYCLRANESGYKVLRVNDAILEHHLGDITQHSLWGKQYYTSNHNYIRRYYNARNRFYVYKKYIKSYPEYIRSDRREFCKEVAKILLFEKDKIRKIYFILLGLWHRLIKKYGKFDA